MSRRVADPFEDASGRTADPVFDGPGPTLAALRAVDWSRTAVGAVAGWPADLARAVHTVVRAAGPMLVWWGADHVQFHNDALVDALGGEPPAVGRPARQCWPDRWQVLGPLAARVLCSGRPVAADDVVLPIDGSPRTYWTMSLAPLHDDRGSVAGVLANAVDLTSRVAAHELARRAADAATANLQAALASNRRIGTAIGILMAERRVTDSAAFDLLREASQRAHRKLRDIAEDVVLTGTLP